ncbi:MAG: PASTA domain-containing protein [Candidatus Aminicenantes bacterium]|nr:PASTA domain-containing protein [Candidatus Aminicenantes bacterium]
MATLPNLSGMTLEEAKEEVEAQKLSLVQSGVALHNRYEKGLIISQDPAPESRLRLYTVVKVTLSAGKEKVIVPRLIGRSQQAILPELQEYGLRLGKVSHVHTIKYSAGRIFGQYPLPEQEVPIDTQLNLLVSEGEEEKKYLMPDLLGKYATVAIPQLQKAGFKVGDTSRAYYPGLDSGIIINQLPQQGNPILKRNNITLEVSK